MQMCIRDGSVALHKRAIMASRRDTPWGKWQLVIIVLGFTAQLLWQYGVSEGAIDKAVISTLNSANSVIGILIVFFLGIQFQEGLTRRKEAHDLYISLCEHHKTMKLLPPLRFYFTSAKVKVCIPEFIRNVDLHETLGKLYPNFDFVGYLSEVTAQQTRLESLKHLHTETNAFQYIFGGVLFVYYTVLVPIAALDTNSDMETWSVYILAVINTLSLLIYAVVDISQGTTIHEFNRKNAEENRFHLSPTEKHQQLLKRSIEEYTV